MIITYDCDSITREQLNHILYKIAKMKCNSNIQYRLSALKGYHIKFECKTGFCEYLRLCYDDPNRVYGDFKRMKNNKQYLCHTLWNCKSIYHKGKLVIRMEASEWFKYE